MYILLVCEILHHDAQAANMMTNQVLPLAWQQRQIERSQVNAMWIVSDCGPHCRSYENAARFLHALPRDLKFDVQALYLREQRGKGTCDGLFGELDHVRRENVCARKPKLW